MKNDKMIERAAECLLEEDPELEKVLNMPKGKLNAFEIHDKILKYSEGNVLGLRSTEFIFDALEKIHKDLGYSEFYANWKSLQKSATNKKRRFET